MVWLPKPPRGAQWHWRLREADVTARILVVDDIAANARLLEARLSTEYYEVKTVHDSRNVIAIARNWQPDAVLLDVMMPEIDGYEVCRRLKAEAATAHIPVIMVTALREPPDRRQGLFSGADEFLSKPVEHEILLARLRGVIRMKRVMDEWRARDAATAALGLRASQSLDEHPAPAITLIVDDLLIRAHRLQDVLARQDIKSILVQHEAEAMAALEGQDFDLITVSLSLTLSDPLRLVAKFQSNASTRETPLLLIAEHDQRDLVIGGLNLGATDCVMLPLDESEFLLRSHGHIRRKKYQDSLRNDVSNALSLAVIDPLTQLFNRRYLTSYLDRLCAEIPSRNFAMLVIDIDHFKMINDRLGHPVGDRVLCSVAEILRANLRKSDLISRYGGEEFVAVIGAMADDERALKVAEKLRQAIEDMTFMADIRITTSIGVSVYDGGISAAALIEQADAALYDAKRTGRNKVMLYTPKCGDENELWSVAGS
ncbi:MAG: PleD family two-component system response regulator [Acidocella sp.]|nr:PleD family two-component system response regulator [Acidocella sp.]